MSGNGTWKPSYQTLTQKCFISVQHTRWLVLSCRFWWGGGVVSSDKRANQFFQSDIGHLFSIIHSKKKRTTWMICCSPTWLNSPMASLTRVCALWPLCPLWFRPFYVFLSVNQGLRFGLTHNGVTPKCEGIFCHTRGRVIRSALTALTNITYTEWTWFLRHLEWL